MHPKCGPKEGHCKETYRNSIKRVKYASYMRTKFRSLQFFTVKRLFSHIERRKQSFRHPWQFKMQIPETEAPSITCTEHLSTVSHTIWGKMFWQIFCGILPTFLCLESHQGKIISCVTVVWRPQWVFISMLPQRNVSKSTDCLYKCMIQSDISATIGYLKMVFMF